MDPDPDLSVFTLINSLLNLPLSTIEFDYSHPYPFKPIFLAIDGY